MYQPYIKSVTLREVLNYSPEKSYLTVPLQTVDQLRNCN